MIDVLEPEGQMATKYAIGNVVANTELLLTERRPSKRLLLTSRAHLLRSAAN